MIASYRAWPSIRTIVFFSCASAAWIRAFRLDQRVVELLERRADACERLGHRVVVVREVPRGSQHGLRGQRLWWREFHAAVVVREEFHVRLLHPVVPRRRVGERALLDAPEELEGVHAGLRVYHREGLLEQPVGEHGQGVPGDVARPPPRVSARRSLHRDPLALLLEPLALPLGDHVEPFLDERGDEHVAVVFVDVLPAHRVVLRRETVPRARLKYAVTPKAHVPGHLNVGNAGFASPSLMISTAREHALWNLSHISGPSSCGGSAWMNRMLDTRRRASHLSPSSSTAPWRSMENTAPPCSARSGLHIGFDRRSVSLQEYRPGMQSCLIGCSALMVGPTGRSLRGVTVLAE
mmetsp:Transcript_58594/g.154856  ORF Transcript_58594/g.154856 Transcript_58594/m.154856 type:complete len:351 (+) Transcript_58594:995-2047(+)